jgi:hypothetical protein
LTHFSNFKIDSFEALSAEPGSYLLFLLENDSNAAWINSAVAAYGANVHPLGKALGGIAATVHF